MLHFFTFLVFSVSLASALPTEASVEQGPAEGLERRLKPSSITEAAAGGSAACQKDHMAHYSQNRDGALRARVLYGILPSKLVPTLTRDGVAIER